MDWIKFIWAVLLQGCLVGPTEPPIYPEYPDDCQEVIMDEDDDDDDEGE